MGYKINWLGQSSEQHFCGTFKLPVPVPTEPVPGTRTFQCTSSCNNTLRCRWIPQRTNKLRVAWQVMDNTRPVRTNTADRAPYTLTTQRYVRVLVCTVCFQWNIPTNPVRSSAHRVVSTHYGAGGYLKEQPKLRVA